MEDFKIFDENGKALHIADVISRFLDEKAKEYKVDKEEITLRVVKYYNDRKETLCIGGNMYEDMIVPNGL